MSALIQQCRDCNTRLFPIRLLCPGCGGGRFALEPVTEGTITVATTLADGTVLATVVPHGGPPLIARITGDAETGQQIPLSNDPSATGPSAYIPLDTPTTATATTSNESREDQ